MKITLGTLNTVTLTDSLCSSIYFCPQGEENRQTHSLVEEETTLLPFPQAGEVFHTEVQTDCIAIVSF